MVFEPPVGGETGPTSGGGTAVITALIGVFAVIQDRIEDWPGGMVEGFEVRLQVGGGPVDGACKENVPVAPVVLFPNGSTAVTVQVQPVKLDGLVMVRLNPGDCTEPPPKD